MRTDDEQLAAFLGSPEITEQLKQLDELHIEIQAERKIKLLSVVLMAATIARRAEKIFPSRAYSKYFKDRGVNPVIAEALASLTISIGTREPNARRQLVEVVRALRFLTPGKNRRRGAMLSRFAVLLAAEDDASMLSEIFRKAGLNGTEPSEFVSLLRVAADGGPLERKRISELAAQVAPSLPSVRGRKVSPASAAHEGFLEMADDFGGRCGYSYREVDEDFVDERTKATRIEFDDPDFDPRASFRRLAARRKARSSREHGTLRPASGRLARVPIVESS